MELLGKTLGNYRIDRLLGEGGMGAVYQAHDLALERDVAIKVIHEHFARQAQFRERFIQEARIMARLDHPGIVKVFSLGKEGDFLYLPMEFIKGGNLRQLLDKLAQERKWIPLHESALLMQQLCQVVDYAHQHGVLHRDIKPANLMLKPERTGDLSFRVVLTDLGLAKLLQGLGMTQEGTYLGTPAYMSPEQASGRETDPRSDVYSLGVLLYELAAGRLPFPIRTITEAIRYHTQERPPRPRSVRPDLPEALEQVILKALEKEPNHRYPNAASMANALTSIMSSSTEISNLSTQYDSSLVTEYSKSLIGPSSPQAASLMTIFDDGSAPVRGESIFDGKSVAPSPEARIQVVYKGKTQAFPIPSSTIAIGRGTHNDVPITDPKASQRHAQITWDGTEYRVMDLKSTNGTYLGNNRLLAGMPEVWRPNQVLRIGDTWLRLIRPAAGLPSGIRSHMSGMKSDLGSVLYTSSGAGLLGVSVRPQQFDVEPGGSVTGTISLLNQSFNVDHFSLSLTGIPSNWISSLPSSVQLMPGAQKESSFTLYVPLSPQSRAGKHPITLKVTSQIDPSQFVEIKLTLTVATYAQFKAELQPQRLRSGQTGRVTVSNQGNNPETFSIQFSDPFGELTFQPPRQQLNILNGGSSTMEYRAQESRVRWIGSEKSHTFSAKVSSPKGEHQTLNADMVSRGMVPVWVLPTVLLLGLLCIGSLIPFLPPLLGAPSASLAPPLLTPSSQNIQVLTNPAQTPPIQTQQTQTDQSQLTQTNQAQQVQQTQTSQAQLTQTGQIQMTQISQAQQTQTAQAQQLEQTQTSQVLTSQTQLTQTSQALTQISQALTLTSQALPAYQNTRYSFRFILPSGATINSQSDEAGRVDLSIITAGTNLREKYIDIRVFEANPCTAGGGGAALGSVTINGIQFLKETASEGAAGSLYDWVAFSTLKNNACISLKFILRSVNPFNFDTPLPVFDKNLESAVFDTVMSSFNWIQ